MSGGNESYYRNYTLVCDVYMWYDNGKYQLKVFVFICISIQFVILKMSLNNKLALPVIITP